MVSFWCAAVILKLWLGTWGGTWAISIDYEALAVSYNPGLVFI